MGKASAPLSRRVGEGQAGGKASSAEDAEAVPCVWLQQEDALLFAAESEAAASVLREALSMTNWLRTSAATDPRKGLSTREPKSEGGGRSVEAPFFGESLRALLTSSEEGGPPSASAAALGEEDETPTVQGEEEATVSFRNAGAADDEGSCSGNRGESRRRLVKQFLSSLAIENKKGLIPSP
ncbi:hypothetical protein cyc_08201 [Cyclospora cayetanensis]|uniref:Uncharacterized protein n=1 Tax=Cyclospora cayetanensis TaxID=88456 RepID=A0A1D3D3S5_9EIME|nr:hypothetical protein cyc_08201 [Cyclospora cayetanensis]